MFTNGSTGTSDAITYFPTSELLRACRVIVLLNPHVISDCCWYTAPSIVTRSCSLNLPSFYRSNNHSMFPTYRYGTSHPLAYEGSNFYANPIIRRLAHQYYQYVMADACVDLYSWDHLAWLVQNSFGQMAPLTNMFLSQLVAYGRASPSLQFAFSLASQNYTGPH